MYRPKPMIPIGEQPILWHIMGKYAQHGFQRFVLCLGYKGEMIRSYFGADPESNEDLTLDHTPVDLSPDTKVRSWQVTLTDTGSASMTGARLALATAKHFQQAEHFLGTVAVGRGAIRGTVLRFDCVAGVGDDGDGFADSIVELSKFVANGLNSHGDPLQFRGARRHGS